MGQGAQEELWAEDGEEQEGTEEGREAGRPKDREEWEAEREVHTI